MFTQIFLIFMSIYYLILFLTIKNDTYLIICNIYLISAFLYHN